MSIERKAEEVREAYRVRPGYWFAPKLFGWGATPVTWQGWLATAVYVGLLIAAVRLLPNGAAKIAAGAPLTLAFMWLAWAKTDGGWHWHWGLRRDR